MFNIISKARRATVPTAKYSITQLDHSSDKQLQSARDDFCKPLFPYVCVTHADFTDEKNYLLKTVFPRIKSLFDEQHSSFHPLDVNWTLDCNQVSNGHALSLSLDFIRKNHYFICLIGERYGPCREATEVDEPIPMYYQEVDMTENFSWLDRNFVIARDSGFPWVVTDGNETKSIQEIEIKQAATFGNPENCFFYFRQPEHLEEKMKGAKDYEILHLNDIYLPKNEEEDRKVRELKQWIVNQGWRVKYYSSLTQLEKCMMDDWTGFLAREVIPHRKCQDIDTEVNTACMTNEAFSQHRTAHFLKIPEISQTFRALTEFCRQRLNTADCNSPAGKGKADYRSYSIRNQIVPQGESEIPKTIAVLSGEKGSGKSAILANWIKVMGRDMPEVKVISTYVGSSKYNQNLCHFMSSCIKQLRRLKYHRERKPSPQIYDDNRPKSFEELEEMFAASLSCGPCVIVIDGLNEMCGATPQTSKQLRNLSWLPHPLPGNCALILSTCDDDLTHQKLSRRRDTVMMTCPGFDDKNFVRDYLIDATDVASHHLTKRVLDKLADFKLCRFPLFLSLISTEITCHNVHHNLLKYIATRKDNGSVYHYWAGMLRRWCKAFGWVNPCHGCPEIKIPDMRGWVADAIILIALSRNGLSRSDILGTLYMMGYAKRDEVQNADWLRLRSRLGRVLHCTSDGRFMFTSQFLLNTTIYILLKSVTSINTSQLTTSTDPTIHSYHQWLANYRRTTTNLTRRAYEFPYHLALAHNLSALKIALMDQELFLKMAGDEKWPSLREDLLMYCALLKDTGYDIATEFTSKLFDIGVVGSPQVSKVNVSELSSSMLTFGGGTMSQITDLPSELTNVNIQYSEDISKNAWMGWHVANLLLEMGDVESANWIFVEVYTFIAALYPPPQENWLLYCRLQRRLADMCIDSGDVISARAWYKNALSTLTDIIDLQDDSMADTLNDLQGCLLFRSGDLYLDENDLDTAQQCYMEAHTCWEKCGNVLQMAEACYKIASLREMYFDYDTAEELWVRALQGQQEWYGSVHPLISSSLYKLGSLKCLPENINGYDVVASEEYLRQALAVEEALMTHGETVKMADILTKLGKILSEESGKYEKAEGLKFLERALDIKNVVLGSDHEESRDLMTAVHQLKTEMTLGQTDIWQGETDDTIRPQSAEYYRDMCRRRRCKSSRSHVTGSAGVRPISRMSRRRPSSAFSHVSHLSARDKILRDDRVAMSRTGDRKGSGADTERQRPFSVDFAEHVHGRTIMKQRLRGKKQQTWMDVTKRSTKVKPKLTKCHSN